MFGARIVEQIVGEEVVEDVVEVVQERARTNNIDGTIGNKLGSTMWNGACAMDYDNGIAAMEQQRRYSNGDTAMEIQQWSYSNGVTVMELQPWRSQSLMVETFHGF